MKNNINFLSLIGCFVIIALFAISASVVYPASRGINVVAATADGGFREISLYKDYHALVVACSDYNAGWPRLANPVKDCKEVTILLKNLGWNVDLLNNPDGKTLLRKLTHLVTGPGRHKDKAVLFWFSGHGYTFEEADGTRLGYLVPVDAPDPDKDLLGFMEKSISMRKIETISKQIRSKHVLMLFDSCFSGAIFQMVRAKPSHQILDKISHPVRQFITAGNENEEVPDKSIFKTIFIQAIQDRFGDINKDRYITGEELGYYLQDKVVNYSRNAQHPQYGKINNPKLDKGDFVFILPDEPGLGHKIEKPAVNNASTDFSDIETWITRQKQMRSDFEKVKSLERAPSLNASAKKEAWKRFLSAYSQNNPYSDEDERFRNEAKIRMEHWEENPLKIPKHLQDGVNQSEVPDHLKSVLKPKMPKDKNSERLSGNVFRIGTLSPLTGPYARDGNDILQGVKTAVSVIMKQGGIPGFDDIEVGPGDSACDGGKATMAAKKLINTGANAIVGAYCSSATIPASIPLNDAGIIQITPSSTHINVIRPADSNKSSGCAPGMISRHGPRLAF